MSDFEKSVMRYLKNIVNKCIHLDKKIESLTRQLSEVRETTMSLGKACGQAFGQTKVVIESLAETALETREDLSEYGGVIIDSSDWC